MPCQISNLHFFSIFAALNKFWVEKKITSRFQTGFLQLLLSSCPKLQKIMRIKISFLQKFTIHESSTFFFETDFCVWKTKIFLFLFFRHNESWHICFVNFNWNSFKEFFFARERVLWHKLIYCTNGKMGEM